MPDRINKNRYDNNSGYKYKQREADQCGFCHKPALHFASLIAKRQATTSMKTNIKHNKQEQKNSREKSIIIFEYLRFNFNIQIKGESPAQSRKTTAPGIKDRSTLNYKIKSLILREFTYATNSFVVMSRLNNAAIFA